MAFAEGLSMGSCLREERGFVKGNGFKQVLSLLTSDFIIDESSALNKNLSLVAVDEHHTIETCQNTLTFNIYSANLSEI